MRVHTSCTASADADFTVMIYAYMHLPICKDAKE